MLNILVITKRQYMNKDLLDDRFGRFREIPLELAKKGHQVIGLCLSYQKKKEGWFIDGSVRWQNINAGLIKPLGLFKFISKAKRLAKEADIIWACSDSFYGVIGCWIGQISNVPVVFDIYDNFGQFLVAKLPIAKQLYHWAIRKSDAITCLSKAFCDYLEKEFQRTKNVFPIEFAVRTDLFCPMDKYACRRFLRLPENALLIGTSGLLSPTRDVNLLVETFLRLKHRYPTLHLVLAGPLIDLALPNDPHLKYLGKLPFEEVPVFNNSLDVAVVCYADDDFGKYCFPQKTREFMACDTPIIAAKVGGLKQMFEGNPKWLYEPGNVDSLIYALERRLTDISTGYPPSPTWADLAEKLEDVMMLLQTEG